VEASAFGTAGGVGLHFQADIPALIGGAPPAPDWCCGLFRSSRQSCVGPHPRGAARSGMAPRAVPLFFIWPCAQKQRGRCCHQPPAL